MQYVFSTRWLKYAFLMLSGLVLTACGGGGGSSSGGFLGGGTNSANTDITINARLIDDAGNAVNYVTPLDETVFEVTLTNGGSPVAGAVVKVSTSVGEVIPNSGSQLSNADGVAIFRLDPGVSNSAGTLTVSVDGYTSTAKVNFQVSAEGLRMGSLVNGNFVDGMLTIGSEAIPYAGSTLVQVWIANADGTLIDKSLPINFYSNCAQLDPAASEVPDQVMTLSGRASFSYTALTCEGVDEIRATTSLAPGVEASGTLTVLSPSLAGIRWSATVPASGQLSLRDQGSNDFPEEADVSFLVTDEGGTPARGVEVTFQLSSTLGDIRLLNTSDVTNNDGIASAKVQTGTVPTSFLVEAQIIIDGRSVSAFSDTLTVTTGLPDQNSFSLAVKVFNVGGGDLDGITDKVSVIAGDRFNNPVKDGTDIVFSTELGVIEADCETGNGACSVNWISGQPRSSTVPEGREQTIDEVRCSLYNDYGPCPAPFGKSLGRRSTIMAVAVGEESFIDANGNGVYDAGEVFKDLSEPFLDYNYDGLYNPLQTPCNPFTDGLGCALSAGETFTDTNENGVWDTANGMYDGSACPIGATYCSRDPVHVRDYNVITMSSGAHNQRIALLSSSRSLIAPGSTLTAGSGYIVLVSDIYNNVPTQGTKVSVAVEDCVLSYGPAGEVPNTSGQGAYLTTFGLGASNSNTTTINGIVTVTVSDADDNSLIARFPCTDPANVVVVDDSPVYTITIEQLDPVYTTTSTNLFRVRVLRNGQNVDGVGVSAVVSLGNLAAANVVTAGGNGAVFTYDGVVAGSDAFTVTVEDPNAGNISQTVAFQVSNLATYLGSFNGAGDFIPGQINWQNPDDTSAAAIGDGDRVTVAVSVANGNLATASPITEPVSVEFEATCTDGTTTVGPWATSTLTSSTAATTTFTVPSGCAPITVEARTTNANVQNSPVTQAIP